SGGSSRDLAALRHYSESHQSGRQIMRLDFAHDHFCRRDALRLGAAGAAAVAAGSILSVEAAGAAPPGPPPDGGPYTDDIFDAEAVAEGGVWMSPYGAADQRGTLNEVTPERTRDALKTLTRGSPVNTYQLGEEMFNGFPAFPSSPPRLHEMALLVFGYNAGQAFVDGGGIQDLDFPFGPNLVVGHEERFAENFTFQIGSQVDGLNHVGIAASGRGGRFYNDNFATDFITPTGTTALGNESMGPIATRGVIVDVVGLKVATGATADYFMAPNGHAVLNDSYRITIDDIENSLHRQRIHKPIGPGDVPILHTGWTHILRNDPGRYLSQEPGIYLAEARYLIDRRVSIVATDTWGLEVLDPSVTSGNAFPCHQELLGRTGVRIGESFVTDAAIADDAYEGVLVVTPENVPGATAGSSAPAFLAQPGQSPRS
ncbi:MAG: cyclase family protein, partial [Acidimicrobiales bacterium]